MHNHNCRRFHLAGSMTKSPPGAQHPPRVWKYTKKGGDYFFTHGPRPEFYYHEKRGGEDGWHEKEYLSLSEHSALLSQAAAEARAEAFEEAAAAVRGRTCMAVEFDWKFQAEAKAARTPEGGKEE